MNKLEHRNLEGELLTITQAQERLNLGAGTIRRLAAESNSVRKIGKSYRINYQKLLAYIEQEFSA